MIGSLTRSCLESGKNEIKAVIGKEAAAASLEGVRGMFGICTVALFLSVLRQNYEEDASV